MTGSSQKKCSPACRAARSACREIKGRLLGCIHSCLEDGITRDEQGCSLSVCTTSNRRCGAAGPGWLTGPAGWTQPVRARPGSTGCPQTALLSSAPSEGSHTARDFNNTFVTILLAWSFFGSFPCKVTVKNCSATRLGLRGLIWVIKFSRVNAMGVPLFEITPSKLNQKNLWSHQKLMQELHKC